MPKLASRASRAQRGMTLIELGLVLAIMVTLLSITVPRVSAMADTAKQEAVAKDLVNLNTMAGALVEKLAYPQPVAPGGVVIPRTPMNNLNPLPPAARDAINELAPAGFDGLNALNDAPFFISMRKPFVATIPTVQHDIYEVTIDTCIPDMQQGVATITGREVELDCALCGADQCQASFTQAAILSNEARELRKKKRMLYCCEARDNTLGEETYGLNCTNWRQPGSSAPSAQFVDNLSVTSTDSGGITTSPWDGNAVSYIQQFCR